MRRLLAIILAVLMLGSVFGTLLYNLVLPIYASEPDERLSLDTDADSLNIRVGLMYGSNVTVGFEVTTPYGLSSAASTSTRPSLTSPRSGSWRSASSPARSTLILERPA